MEDSKKIIDTKLNIDSLEDLPRDETGKVIIEEIATGKDDKGNWIVPDEVLEKYYKELPHNTKNQSGTAWSSSNGILRLPNEEVHRKGAEALNARVSQRKSNKEILEEIARRNTPIEELERLGLEDSSDNNMLVAANYAAVLKAIRGDVKALEYVRDTLGEKPTDKISAEVTALTPEDREMLERVSKRLDTTSCN